MVLWLLLVIRRSQIRLPVAIHAADGYELYEVYNIYIIYYYLCSYV